MLSASYTSTWSTIAQYDAPGEPSLRYHLGGCVVHRPVLSTPSESRQLHLSLINSIGGLVASIGVSSTPSESRQLHLSLVNSIGGPRQLHRRASSTPSEGLVNSI